MSSIAVFLVLGGATAFAAGQLGKNTVGSKQLKKNAVTAAKLKNNAVTGSKIAKDAITAEKIKNGAVTGAKVDVASLGTVPKAASAATATTAGSAGTFSGYSRKGLVRVAASPEGASFEATRAASPEIPLVTAGPFTVYGKCFHFGGTSAEIFIRTSENGSIFDSDSEELIGSPEFLNANTAENLREIGSTSAAAGDASYFGVHSPEFTAMAPSGAALRGDFQLGAKNGNLPAGNGVYGPGDVCLFAAEATALNG
ncbi:MAG TPA: hypothetical protein VF081_04270 [Solirubrobacterales bacterium]